MKDNSLDGGYKYIMLKNINYSIRIIYDVRGEYIVLSVYDLNKDEEIIDITFYLDKVEIKKYNKQYNINEKLQEKINYVIDKILKYTKPDNYYNYRYYIMKNIDFY